MIPPNPLTKPHIDKLAGLAEPVGSPGEEEVERRAQEVLNEWFRFYFGGMPFSTPADGAVEAKTFADCEILWDQATPSSPAAKPILHLILADRTDGDPIQVAPNLWRNHGKWTWNALVRVSPQLPVNPALPAGDDAAILHAPRLCRRVADQCGWLLKSSHIQELAAKGIGHLKIINGPRAIAGGQWHLRQVVFSAEVVWHHRSNLP